MKSGHRVKPTVETEHIFIEIGLKMFGLDTAVVGSLDPRLHVAEDEVDHGQVGLCLVWIASECQRLMAISHLENSTVTAPSVAPNGGASCNILFDKASEQFGATIRHDAKPQPSCIDPAFVRLNAILARPDLDGSDYDRFVVRATAFSARLAADIALIDFDRMLTADAVAFWANHASAKLVEYLKGRLIAGKCELTLELNGGLTGYLCGHEVCAPKPSRERRMARLHNGARRNSTESQNRGRFASRANLVTW
jgi:hypothetical protein